MRIMMYPKSPQIRKNENGEMEIIEYGKRENTPFSRKKKKWKWKNGENGIGPFRERAFQEYDISEKIKFKPSFILYLL